MMKDTECKYSLLVAVVGAKYDVFSYSKLQRKNHSWSQGIEVVRDNIKPYILSLTQNRHLQNQRDNYFLQDNVLYFTSLRFH